MTATPETGATLFPAGTVEPDYVLDKALDTDAAGAFDAVSDTDRGHWMRARRFVQEDLLPVIGEHWDRSEYPLELVHRLGELDALGFLALLGPSAVIATRAATPWATTASTTSRAGKGTSQPSRSRPSGLV